MKLNTKFSTKLWVYIICIFTLIFNFVTNNITLIFIVSYFFQNLGNNIKPFSKANRINILIYCINELKLLIKVKKTKTKCFVLTVQKQPMVGLKSCKEGQYSLNYCICFY